jgi:hypothetical protein
MKLTTTDFIKNAIEIHGNKYDYSKADYINAYTKVCIICPEHGEFWQIPHNHITNKAGCPQCSKYHKRYNTNSFIEIVKTVHGNKYDYSKVIYEHCNKKVCIICPEHGEFWQTPSKHMAGQGCPECSYIITANKTRKTTEQFINEAKLIHNNKYDYSKAEYKNAYKKVIIICPKHGEFKQTPHHHLNYHGCPNCNNSILENEIQNLLVLNNIEFIPQYRAKWLGRQSLDFYLPMHKIAIECQGEQHFQKVYYRSKKWSEEKAQTNFQQIQKRDKMKRDKCSKQHIQLLYYTNKNYDDADNVITDKQELLEIIKRKNC